MFHPISHREMEVVALVRALERDTALFADAIQYLRSKVASMQSIQSQMHGPTNTLSDADVERRITKTTPKLKIPQKRS